MGRLHLRVQPGARRTAFTGWYGNLPKLSVAAPPVDGAANEAVVSAVARALGVRTRQVRLVGGERSRTKRLDVEGLSDEEVLRRVRGFDGL